MTTNADDSVIKRAWNMGVLYGHLMQAKEHMLMGKAQDAIHKLTEAMKHMGENLVSEFYVEFSTTKEDSNAKENSEESQKESAAIDSGAAVPENPSSNAAGAQQDAQVNSTTG